VSYGTQVLVDAPFPEVVERARTALASQGFGVLTEIDVTATLRAKLGAQLEDYVILGACNPPFAHQALDIDRSIGLLLPCNVVVRATAEGTLVEALDPGVHGDRDRPGRAEASSPRGCRPAQRRARQPHPRGRRTLIMA